MLFTTYIYRDMSIVFDVVRHLPAIFSHEQLKTKNAKAETDKKRKAHEKEGAGGRKVWVPSTHIDVACECLLWLYEEIHAHSHGNKKTK